MTQGAAPSPRGGTPWVPVDGPWPWVPRVNDRLLVILRAIGAALWTLLCAPVQAVLLLLPGRGKAWFAAFYWAGICRVMGLRVRLVGAPLARGLPVVFVSNHSSWLDIPALGSCLQACFIAKGEVGHWPVISIVARLGRTVFVSRKMAGAARENTEIRARLAGGDSLILFPEGTTSDGVRVMPFRSAFLAIAESDLPHILQPVSIVYDELDWLPARRGDRALFAWFGDMDLASHFNRIARHRGLRVTIMLHPPIPPDAGLNRKQLAQSSWRQVALAAAELRQNRQP
jgi:lyso-ornithine lipid O-acyltransferase